MKPALKYSFVIGYGDFDQSLLGQERFDIESDQFRNQVTSFFVSQYKKLGGKAQVLFDDTSRLITVQWSPGETGQNPDEHILNLLKQGDYRSAVPLLWTKIQQDPEDGSALLNLGMVLSDLKRFDRAEEFLTRAKNLGVPNAAVALGVLFVRSGNMQRGRQELETAIREQPQNPWARQNLGACLLKLQEWEKAREQLAIAVQLDSSNVQAALGLANALEELGEHSEADEIYQKIVETSRNREAVELAKEGRTRIAHVVMRQRGGGFRPDAMMYLSGAIKKLQSMSHDAAKALFTEIAILGMSGLDINNPDKKYRIRTLSGEYSGLHLLCYMYAAGQIVAPGQDIGIDLSKEYEAARSMDLGD